MNESERRPTSGQQKEKEKIEYQKNPNEIKKYTPVTNKNKGSGGYEPCVPMNLPRC
jgi:hypothetical protein